MTYKKNTVGDVFKIYKKINKYTSVEPRNLDVHTFDLDDETEEKLLKLPDISEEEYTDEFFAVWDYYYGGEE